MRPMIQCITCSWWPDIRLALCTAIQPYVCLADTSLTDKALITTFETNSRFHSLTTMLENFCLVVSGGFRGRPNHRRIQRGVGGSGPPRNLVTEVRGVRVPVKYPQDPLIKQVFVLCDGYSWKYECVAQSGMDVKQLVTMDGTGGH